MMMNRLAFANGEISCFWLRYAKNRLVKNDEKGLQSDKSLL